MQEIVNVCVIGNAGEYDEYVCDSPEVARLVAEREYIDYFGKSIEWSEPNFSGGEFIAQFGKFYSYAHSMKSIMLTAGTVLTRADLLED